MLGESSEYGGSWRALQSSPMTSRFRSPPQLYISRSIRHPLSPCLCVQVPRIQHRSDTQTRCHAITDSGCSPRCRRRRT
ncbi:hypothetical protein L227DRAFT_228843 [Lentinus tigrinus ALCF2SS1-6]|uniref:Uncharacterized protein n=1 Tax=Lentinus tigrinus ALCF2SS1-6 TaxID=1328759 RepID=A0A5C2S1M9_9APHY|nr:hypothetical protein L227DRAFT_228843 [Lentinus tigrinus ALCF2SS1-6]